jgi:hypothetical protein
MRIERVFAEQEVERFRVLGGAAAQSRRNQRR